MKVTLVLIVNRIRNVGTSRESLFGGMERWNGTVEWNGGMDYRNEIVEWPRPRNAARSASWVV